jgi:hypothetical protein
MQPMQPPHILCPVNDTVEYNMITARTGFQNLVSTEFEPVHRSIGPVVNGLEVGVIKVKHGRAQTTPEKKYSRNCC